MTAYIILNGEKTENIKEVIGENQNIYCADGGADYLCEQGIIPKIIMGDMDSISDFAKSFYEDKGCSFEIFPCEKDETDGELIVEKALRDNPDEVIILCGLGGRIDHMLGNFQLLYRIALRGVTGKIIGNDILGIMSKDKLVIKKKDNQLVSVIPYEDNTVLTLKGFRYNVEQFKFEKDTPIGLSNYLLEKEGEITVHSGCPLVIVSENQK